MSSILSHHHQSLLLHHHHPSLYTPTRFYCSTAAAPHKPPRNPNPTILKVVPLHVSAPLNQNRPTLTDPSLQSTWSHRAWLASGCTSLLFSLVKCLGHAAQSHSFPEPILAAVLGYVLADLGSGIYHWGIDNYGDSTTPLFGSQIEAFQGHHRWPWTITRRQFANNLHALARIIAFTVTPVSLACDDPTVLGFVFMFSGCIMFSQQFHAWAHMTKSRLPSLVLWLQDAGILVSRGEHSDHHRQPYNNNYCIVSGAWNGVLDKNKVFEAMEMVLYFKLGVRPRSWTEPNSDWTEETGISTVLD
ncbi:fatty acid desaturase 4, chloroplastic-like [Impatiens glandulifera]|uniref:fatty acid desaturase 4, chloroplastic-like n=1 Tax=Impatiens glandulifera TaxID=253017 RepID=UPI001FB17863|nr:fatty acid desaturase 4, chloroplastic-like [Impatiens glandulifera]